MRTGPERLLRGGGTSARLLDSAGIDKPSRASRARALELAATAGAFVATTAGAPVAVKAASGSLYKTVAAWVCIGAIGGGVVAFGVAALLGPSERPGDRAAPVLLEPETPRAVPAPAPVVAAPAITPEVASPLAPIREAVARKDFQTALALLDKLSTQSLSEGERLEATQLRARVAPAVKTKP